MRRTDRTPPRPRAPRSRSSSLDASCRARRPSHRCRRPGRREGRPAAIESVLIPQRDRAQDARDRLTLCISSQAGCGMGCTFCATARMGLVRNLSPSEIVGQVRAAATLAAPEPVTNIVLMGMGEPLANYDAVRTAVEILTAGWGVAVSPR